MRSSEHGIQRLALRLVLCLGLACCVSVAAAQQATKTAEPPSPALLRAQSLLKQLAQEKAQLQADNVKLQAQVAAAEREGKRAESERENLEADLAASGREKDQVNTKLTHTGERLQKVEQRLREIVDQYKQLAAEHKETLAAKQRVEGELASTKAELDDAERKNLALYQANVELLDKFSKKGPFEALLQKEPLTGIKQVEIENLLQEYQYKLEDQRYQQKAAVLPASPQQ